MTSTGDFEIVVFKATHFFGLHNNEDEFTRKFRESSTHFIELSGDRGEAAQQVIEWDVDVLIYPSIGMDAWIMLFAHQRLAPIQCMLWGHPITSGLKSIDYFIGSGKDRDQFMYHFMYHNVTANI